MAGAGPQWLSQCTQYTPHANRRMLRVAKPARSDCVVLDPGPHAAMSPLQWSLPRPTGTRYGWFCRGRAPSVGSSLLQWDRERNPFPANHRLMSAKVQSVPWFPMHMSSTEQLRCSGRDGYCGELGSRTGQPLEPSCALGKRQVAVECCRSAGRQSTAGWLVSSLR